MCRCTDRAGLSESNVANALVESAHKILMYKTRSHVDFFIKFLFKIRYIHLRVSSQRGHYRMLDK